jgi:hypothetical protein
MATPVLNYWVEIQSVNCFHETRLPMRERAQRVEGDGQLVTESFRQ